MVTAKPSLRADPPSSGLTQKFAGSMRGRASPKGQFFSSRFVVDNVNHVLFGYELLLVQQQPGTYLATFGKLGLTPLELSMDMLPQTQIDWREWTTRPLPSIPKPRTVHDGETISVDLFVDAATGEKLIDDIRIQSSSVRRPVPPPPPPPPPVKQN